MADRRTAHPIAIRFSNPTRAALEAAVDLEERSRNNLVEMATRYWLAQRGYLVTKKPRPAKRESNRR